MATPEPYLKPSPTSMMEIFSENRTKGFQPLTSFA